ncbi:amino acid/polyamine transporter [Rhodococcus opacus M213]|uniref:Amino acid/polyamine transporter n=1 Tax=Rhodococcus opacus M213 TaxID=1129896 RepID=K8XWA2_RHOOP|nr:amino acid permease [Rhodococcus opacus]EKT81435.1 amino acid/polyamine transporter [Rhodococcus opacus M213]
MSTLDHQPETLQKSLKQRHLTMIAIGGVVGAGLFVGSSALLHTSGPAAFVSYAITGVVIVLVMRMLGEMATTNPSTGSFAGYARKAFGGWAGFTTGWLYWFFWVVVVGAEAVIGGKLLQRWIDLPSWMMAVVLLLAMVATNLRSVRNFGEFEYWFAGIKVAAILLFLGLGAAYVFGLWPSHSADFSNLTDHGGFTPNGWTIILSGVVVAVFSMVGPEIATIAAAESAEPEKAVAKATNSVIARIGFFYIGSVLLLAIIVPWTDVKVGQSPFVDALTHMGIPGGPDIMNAVILVAVLSCLNSGLYTSSRMLFTLAHKGDAPQAIAKLDKHGVPRNSLLLATLVGFACIGLDYLSPETVFVFLLNASGATILMVYLMIAMSQIKLRGLMTREEVAQLRLKMWLFPYLSILAAVGILAVLISMFFVDSTRSQITLSVAALAVTLIAYRFRRRIKPAGAHPLTPHVSAAAPESITKPAQ